MKSTIVWIVLGATFLLVGNSVNAWGGIYNNRFSPEMLQNSGYGIPHHMYQVSVAHPFSFTKLTGEWDENVVRREIMQTAFASAHLNSALFFMLKLGYCAIARAQLRCDCGRDRVLSAATSKTLTFVELEHICNSKKLTCKTSQRIIIIIIIWNGCAIATPVEVPTCAKHYTSCRVKTFTICGSF